MSNKPFDLEKALTGEPVKLRNGAKAYVKYVMPDDYKGAYPLRGFYCSSISDTSYEDIIWTKKGNNFHSEDFSELDIIGMWEEPRPRVQFDLPAPLKTVEKGQEVYFIEPVYALGGISEIKFNETVNKYIELYENGCLFATKEDAKEWLNAMRNARR